MLHHEVLNKYKELFPFGDQHIESWFPNGRNSVRVRFKYGFTVVFTYQSEKKWRLETVDQFEECMNVR